MLLKKEVYNFNRLIIFFVIYFICLNNILKAQIQFDFNANYRYLTGSSATSISEDWMTETYPDLTWSSGYAPFRYGDGAGGTLLADMQNNYSCLYLRSVFNAVSVDQIKEIILSVNFDDGFVIWINGKEVLSQNAPADLSAASLATTDHESGTPVSYTLDSSEVFLREGENLLCIQAFNVLLSSSDFYFDMGIQASLSLPEISDSLQVTFDHESGFYQNVFNLKLETEVSGYNIAYTLDGSNPQTSSTKITSASPVSIEVNTESTVGRVKTPVFIVRASLAKEGYTPSKPITRSFIFINKVLSQGNPGGNWPSSAINGQIIDLEMDAAVVNDARYKASIEESLLEVPSISLVTDQENLFDPSSGIYVNATMHGEQWERECSVELINPDKSEGFQVNAGIRIRGGNSRNDDNPKHAFRLFFRKQYGAGKLLFPLFDDEGPSEYDKIDLRTAQNYSWSMDGSEHNTFLRDIFSRDSQRDLSQPYTRGRYYHLYLNGMYWGLYQTEERPEANYAETYFGGDEDDYDVVKVAVETWPYYNEVTDGTMDAWKDLWNKCSKGFASNADYFALEGRDQNRKPVKNTRVYVDIDNLIDYMLVIFYTGNVDAPVSAWHDNNMPNNYFAIFNRQNKGKGFVFVGHDSEHSMFINPIYVTSGIDENRVTIDDPAMSVSSVSNFQPQWLHEKLTKNTEYRIRFADKAYRQFTSGGVFSVDKCTDRFQVRKDQIDMAIIAESARWGDAQTYTPRNKYDDWLPEVYDIEDNFFPDRTDIVINQLKAVDLYPSLNTTVIKKSGEALNENVHFSEPCNISFINPNSKGQIYYTTNGIDPRETGGTITPSAVLIANNSSLSVSQTTMIKSRILDGTAWSAMKEICFLKSQEDYSGLKVTEVHYHPADLINGTDTVEGKDLEFIELKNTSDNAMDISGIIIDSAVFYIVPVGIILPPKGFYVVASKPVRFYDFYGMNPSGNFKGNLSNGGEYILINSPDHQKILSFIYSDISPWPLSPDGDGYSLVANISLPTGDPNSYEYWRSSLQKGGSPFSDDDLSSQIEMTENSFDVNILGIYPNPVTDIFYIRTEQAVSENLNVQLTDLHGKIVFVKEVTNNTGIDLSETSLKKGIYIVSVKYKNNTWHSKMVYTSGN